MKNIFDFGFNKNLTRLSETTADEVFDTVQPSQIVAGSLDLGKIQILPDEETGMVAKDDDGSDAFKIMSGGLDIGDVIMGNSAGQNAKWDKSAGTFTVTGTITATGGAIGGWSIDTTSIFTGTEDHSGYTANAGDLTIYSNGTVASIHGKEFYIATDGKLTCTSITATGTINAQAGYLASGVYVDTVNGLLCESGGINVGVAGHVRGGATDYNTGTGFFLGYDTDAYKFSVGDPSGKYLAWDGSGDFIVNGIALAEDVESAAGDLLVVSSDSATSTFSQSYVKLKEISIAKKGSLRIKFNLYYTPTVGYAVYGRIYKNGVAVGTERSNSSASPGIQYSEDIDDFEKGDLVQIYAHTSSIYTQSGVNNFRIYSDAYEVSTAIL